MFAFRKLVSSDVCENNIINLFLSCVEFNKWDKDVYEFQEHRIFCNNNRHDHFLLNSHFLSKQIRKAMAERQVYFFLRFQQHERVSKTITQKLNTKH